MYVVTCKKNGIRFFLTEQRMYSDIPERAWRMTAEQAIQHATSEEIAHPWGWRALRQDYVLCF